MRSILDDQAPRGRRRRRAAMFLTAAAAATLALSGNGRAQVLFSDDFNTSSVGRYDVYSFDNSVSTTNVVAGYPTSNDVGINENKSPAVAFNYGAYTYRHISDNEIDTVYDPIPVAPRTTDGSTLGLRLDANSTATGGTGTAIINLLPKVSQFTGGVLPSGNFKMTVDVWMNYNGPATGGTGSTEYMLAGINQTNPAATNGLAGPVFTNPAVQQRGSAIAIDGETGSGTDYRIYTDNSRLGDYDSSTGYVAQVQSGGISRSNGEFNPFYDALFPYPTYESVGGIGKHWVTLEIKYVDGVTYYSIDPNTGAGMTLIATHTDRTSTSGNVALGYADLNSGVAALENSGPIVNQDASFVVYDNLVVEQLAPSAAQPTWTTAGGSWNAGGNWTIGAPDSNTGVATFGASAGGSTVSVDAPVTAREVVFDNAGMTLAGPATLTLSSPGVTGGDMAVFTVKQGNHTVSAPIVLNQNLLVHTDAANSSLTLARPIPTSTYQLTKSGAGTLTMPANKSGGITVLGGTVNIAPGSGTLAVDNFLIVGSVTAQRGSIDINDNKMVYDYNPDLPTTSYTNLRDSIRGAYNAGAWNANGLTSSLVINDPNKVKGLGYWDASVLTGVTDGSTATWFGQTVDASTFLIAVTYMGDINFDGKVDGDDFSILDRGKLLYGVATNVDPRGIATGRAKWQDGDLNYDGAITAADYMVIDRTYGILSGGLSPSFLAQREAEFGSDYVSALVASVPEPGVLAAGGLALLALVRGRGAR